MKKLIMPVGGLFYLFVAALVVSLVQGIINSAIKGNGAEVFTNTSCEAWNMTVSDTTDKVRLELDCQGTITFTDDPEVVVSYIKNRGPVTCTIYESGKTKCQPRQQNAEVSFP